MGFRVMHINLMSSRNLLIPVIPFFEWGYFLAQYFTDEMSIVSRETKLLVVLALMFNLRIVKLEEFCFF